MLSQQQGRLTSFSHLDSSSSYSSSSSLSLSETYSQTYIALATMADNGVVSDSKKNNPFSVKLQSGQKLILGAIVEVVNLEQAKIAEQAGASAVLVSDSPHHMGIARMPDPSLIKEIKSAVSIPVMAKCRVGHLAEAQFLEVLGVACIDENEVLAPSDYDYHIDQHTFKLPFCCGCRDLGEALTRVNDGAALIRTQGHASVMGNIAETVRNVRLVMKGIEALSRMDDNEVYCFAKEISVPNDLAKETKQMGRLPVLQFAAGGIATPADASLMMQLGCDGVFVGSEIFLGSDSFKRLQAIIRGVTHYNDPNSWVI